MIAVVPLGWSLHQTAAGSGWLFRGIRLVIVLGDVDGEDAGSGGSRTCCWNDGRRTGVDAPWRMRASEARAWSARAKTGLEGVTATRETVETHDNR